MVDTPNSQVFIIVFSRNADSLDDKLTDAGVKYTKLTEESRFVVYAGTARELADMLGIRSGDHGTGVVCPISNYSGRAPSDLWEWFKVNWPT